MVALEPIRLQRTRGELRLRMASHDGVTHVAEAFQSGALRVRFPRTHRDDVPGAVLINTAGGMTGGDLLDIRVTMEPQTKAVICGQACEKIYRSPGGWARIQTKIHLEACAEMDWLPQPCILFDRARLTRQTQVTMAEDARLLALEAGILGRTAMNESFAEGEIRDSWSVRRGDRLIYADRFLLSGARSTGLSEAWAFGGARAYATLLYVAPDAEKRVDEMRALLEACQGRVAASAWNGMLVTRLLAEDGYALNLDLVHILAAFRESPLPRLWSI